MHFHAQCKGITCIARKPASALDLADFASIGNAAP
jgi:hypothetical protein